MDLSSEDVARAMAALVSGHPAMAAAVAAQAQNQGASTSQLGQNASLPQYSVPGPVVVGASKYNQLVALIEELGKDIRPTYTGNRNCSERLKRGIMHARIMVRECQQEIEKNQKAAQQQQN